MREAPTLGPGVPREGAHRHGRGDSAHQPGLRFGARPPRHHGDDRQGGALPAQDHRGAREEGDSAGRGAEDEVFAGEQQDRGAADGEVRGGGRRFRQAVGRVYRRAEESVQEVTRGRRCCEEEGVARACVLILAF